MGYPQIIHSKIGFSHINHPAIKGYPHYGKLLRPLSAWPLGRLAARRSSPRIFLNVVPLSVNLGRQTSHWPKKNPPFWDSYNPNPNPYPNHRII